MISQLKQNLRRDTEDAMTEYLKKLPEVAAKEGDFIRPDMAALDTKQKIIDKGIELGFSAFAYKDKYSSLANRCEPIREVVED
jgi:hypothetical protein